MKNQNLLENVSIKTELYKLKENDWDILIEEIN